MSAVATAVIGSAVIGAYSSKRASDKASDAAKSGIKSTTQLAERARSDAVNLFNMGRQSRLLGQGAAFNFIRDNATRSAVPLVQGNMMAQRAIGQGGIQANNAILGLPVDMSFAQQPQQVQAEYPTGMQLPTLPSQYLGSAAPTQAPTTQSTQPLSDKLGGWNRVRF